MLEQYIYPMIVIINQGTLMSRFRRLLKFEGKEMGHATLETLQVFVLSYIMWRDVIYGFSVYI